MGQINIVGLRKELTTALDSSGEEKLQLLRRVLAKITTAEKVFCSDFNIPFGLVTAIREMIPEVQAGINRLEAGARRRQANQLAKEA